MGQEKRGIIAKSYKKSETDEKKPFPNATSVTSFASVTSYVPSDTSSVFEMAIEEKPVNSNLCVYAILLCEVTLFLQLGFVATSLNPATPALLRFYNQIYVNRYNVSASEDTLTLLNTLTQSTLLAGGFFGALSSKILSAHTSRLGGMMVYHVLVLISVVLMSAVAYYAESYEAMIIGRLVNGFGRGIGLNMVQIYVSESTCREKLTVYQSPSGWLMTAGCLLGNVLGHPKCLGSDGLWPYLMVVPAVFPLAYILSVFWIPQTPAYWIEKKDRERALFTLKKLRNNCEKTVEYELTLIEDEMNKRSHSKPITLVNMCKKKSYRGQLIAALCLLINQQTIGMVAIMLYSDQIFIDAGIPPDLATYASIGVFAVAVIMAVIGTILLMKRYDGRRILITGNLIIALGFIILTVSNETQDTVSWMSYISIAALAIYMVGLGLGPTVMGFALAAQATEQRTRPIAMVVAGSTFWVLSWVVGFTTPYMLESLGGYTWLIFAGITIALSIYFVIFLGKVITDASNSNKSVPRNASQITTVT